MSTESLEPSGRGQIPSWRRAAPPNSACTNCSRSCGEPIIFSIWGATGGRSVSGDGCILDCPREGTAHPLVEGSNPPDYQECPASRSRRIWNALNHERRCGNQEKADKIGGDVDNMVLTKIT